MELIARFGWKSYTILYEDNQGLIRLQELLKSPTQSDIKISVRQLPSDDDYRYIKHTLFDDFSNMRYERVFVALKRKV